MSLDPAFPFVEFESDETAYAKSRLFWRAAFDQTMGEARSSWHDWMTDPFDDGHPIFSALDRDARRGVLLQQVPRSDDPVWFKCWLSETEGAGSNDRIAYLLMETHVSLESRQVFQDLVGHWCERGVDERAMTLVIEQLRPSLAAEKMRQPVKLDHSL